MPDDRIWATTPKADDCWLDDFDRGPPCDMCGAMIVALHIHVETDSPSADDPRRTFGFCSEACAGRWAAGELVRVDRDMVAFTREMEDG